MFKCLSLVATGKVGRIVLCSIIGLLCSAFFFQAAAQQSSISLQGTKTVSEFLKEIEAQTNYRFVYNNDILNDTKTVSATVQNVGIDEALRVILAGQNVEYVKQSNGVVVMTAGRNTPVAMPATRDVIVTGTVKDKAGTPLANISVTIPGTTLGTVTNNNGQFSIRASKADSLVFSSVNYVQQSVFVGNNTLLNIVLEAQEGSLGEVVVVGYGQQRKISTVGAQATVKAEDLKIPVRDLTNGLAGRLAGVTAIQRSGEPGYDGAELYIRGIATVASSQRGPLFVVDGVPDRSINNIDPEDIESFTVLKDASATAVYGTRGANGVIVVNTKKGRNVTRPQVTIELNKGISGFTQLPQFVDAPTFLSLYNEAEVMRGYATKYPDSIIQKHASGIDPDVYPNVDWFDVLFNKYGQNQRANISVRGGSNFMNYYLSAGYFGESGMFKKGDVNSYNSNLNFDRYNFLTKIIADITKTTKVELGVNGYITNGNMPGTYQAANIFHFATLTPPHIVPVQYSNGQWPELKSVQIPSPYMLLTQSGYTTRTNTVLRSNIRLTQELDFILKGLSAHTMFSFDNNNYGSFWRFRTLPTYYVKDLNNPRDPEGNLITIESITNGRSTTLSFNSDRSVNRRLYSESGLNYNNTFGAHNVTSTLLFHQSDFLNFNPSNNTFKNAIPSRSRGLVGRVNYGYNNRYFIEGSFGYTGSENFAPSKRYGFFPAGGVGWIVSNEKFFDNIKNVISYLKLRYSYGLSGNGSTDLGRFLYLDEINEPDWGFIYGVPGKENYLQAMREGQIAVDVTWETSYRHNLGIELNTWNNALQFIVELFKERREGILIRNMTIPYASGIRPDNVPVGNVGITSNKGIDVTVTLDKKINRDLGINFNGTFTYNMNKYVQDGLPPWQYPWLNRDGYSIDQRFGFVALGLFKDSTEIVSSPVQPGDVRPGDIKYKDLNNDGKITSADVTAIGYGSVPKILYGLNFGLGYKGFDLSLFFQGAALLDFNYGTNPYTGGSTWTSGNGNWATVPFAQGPTAGNLYTTALDRWTPERAAADPNFRPFYPRLSSNDVTTTNYQSGNMSGYTSTWWVYRADYLRLKNAELGYNFSNQFLNRLAINKARIFLSGTNLFTWSKWKIWDPEMGDGGGIRYPNTTVYNVGARFNFN